jgi:hypothetical protein
MKVLHIDGERMAIRIPAKWSPGRKVRDIAKDSQFGQLLRWWIWVTNSTVGSLAKEIGVHEATIARFFSEPVIHERFLLPFANMFESVLGRELDIDVLRKLAETPFKPAGPQPWLENGPRPWQQFAMSLQAAYLKDHPNQE